MFWYYHHYTGLVSFTESSSARDPVFTNRVDSWQSSHSTSFGQAAGGYTRTLWAFGAALKYTYTWSETHSTSTLPATDTRVASQLGGGVQGYSSSGSPHTYEPPVANANVPYAFAGGTLHSSGIDTPTYTVFASTTEMFSDYFYFYPPNEIPITIEAPGSRTTISYNPTTLTFLSVTTTAKFARKPDPGNSFLIERKFITRDIPSGYLAARKVAMAYALTGTSGDVVSRLGTGDILYDSDLGVGTSSSSGPVLHPLNTAVTIGGQSHTFITNKNYQFTSYSPDIIEVRRRNLDQNYPNLPCLDTANGIIGDGLSFGLSVPDWLSQSILVGREIYSFSVFTDVKSASDSGGTTWYAWTWSGSWRLEATSKQVATATTSAVFSIPVSITGTVGTFSENNMWYIGNTRAPVGPFLPFTISSLNEISITTNFDSADSNAKYAFYYGLGSTTAGSSSTIISQSSSSILTLGSNSSPVLTYTNSDLPWFVYNIYVAFETHSAYWKGPPDIHLGNKWNENQRGPGDGYEYLNQL